MTRGLWILLVLAGALAAGGATAAPTLYRVGGMVVTVPTPQGYDRFERRRTAEVVVRFDALHGTRRTVEITLRLVAHATPREAAARLRAILRETRAATTGPSQERNPATLAVTRHTIRGREWIGVIETSPGAYAVPRFYAAVGRVLLEARSLTAHEGDGEVDADIVRFLQAVRVERGGR